MQKGEGQADVWGRIVLRQIRASETTAGFRALGKPTLLKQSEKHDGPHAAHFWDVERAGGGVTMGMGCHAIEFFRWMLGRPKIKSVYAQMNTQVHGDKTKGDDNAILILEFENGTVAVAEESSTSSAEWTTALK